jgi:predicted site-specific integrase-resolvase
MFDIFQDIAGPEDRMIVGYARTSTTDQKAGLEAQEHDLKAA